MLRPSCQPVLQCCAAWIVSAHAMSKQGGAAARLALRYRRAALWAGRLMPLLLPMRWHSNGTGLP